MIPADGLRFTQHFLKISNVNLKNSLYFGQKNLKTLEETCFWQVHISCGVVQLTNAFVFATSIVLANYILNQNYQASNPFYVAVQPGLCLT